VFARPASIDHADTERCHGSIIISGLGSPFGFTVRDVARAGTCAARLGVCETPHGVIQTPAFMKGVEHFTFHMSGPTAVLQAGSRLVAKGYESFWGPGRHKFGSNWFWYFNSPVACHVEYDADMDLHDDSWVAREAPMQVDESQIFLFQHREKWAPGGAPPPGRVRVDAVVDADGGGVARLGKERADGRAVRIAARMRGRECGGGRKL